MAPRDQGVARTYAADYSKTLLAAEEALDKAGLRWNALNRYGIIFADLPHRPGETDDEIWSLYATPKGERAWSGDQVRVVVQQTAPMQTTVRVISKHRMETLVGRKGDYSGAILDEIGRRTKQD